MTYAFKQGDRVYLDETSRGTISAVLPRFEDKPQTYLVEMATGGFVVSAGDRLTLIDYWKLGCECGSQRVPGMANTHSRWCPAFEATNLPTGHGNGD